MALSIGWNFEDLRQVRDARKSKRFIKGMAARIERRQEKQLITEQLDEIEEEPLEDLSDEPYEGLEDWLDYLLDQERFDDEDDYEQEEDYDWDDDRFYEPGSPGFDGDEF